MTSANKAVIVTGAASGIGFARSRIRPLRHSWFGARAEVTHTLLRVISDSGAHATRTSQKKSWI